MDYRKETYTDEEIDQMKKEIKNMSRWQIADMIRYEPSGHAFFRSDFPLYDILMARFKEMGGWSPDLSKAIDRARGR